MGPIVESRTRIIETATELFLKLGISNTTFAAIAKGAQLTQPAIYAHFENRMDLLKNVILHSAESGRVFIDEKVNPREPALKRLKSYIEANLDFFRTKKPQAHSLMAVYYFALSDDAIMEVYRLIEKSALERLDMILTQASFEKTVRFSRVELPQTIHLIMVGGCYKAIYARNKQEFEAVRQSTWNAVQTLVEA